MREEYIYRSWDDCKKSRTRDRKDIEPFSGNNDRPTNRTKDGHEGSSTCHNVGAHEHA